MQENKMHYWNSAKENFFVNPRFIKKIKEIDNFPLTVIGNESLFNMQLILDYWLNERGMVYTTNDYGGDFQLFWHEIFKAISKADSNFPWKFQYIAINFDDVVKAFEKISTKENIYIVTKYKYFIPCLDNPFELVDVLKCLPKNIHIIALMESKTTDFNDKMALSKITNVIYERDFLLDGDDIDALALKSNVEISADEKEAILQLSGGSYVTIYAFFELKKIDISYKLKDSFKVINDYVEKSFDFFDMDLTVKAGLLGSFNLDEFILANTTEGMDFGVERYHLKLHLKRICSKSILIYYNKRNHKYYVYKEVGLLAFEVLKSGGVSDSVAKKLAKICFQRKDTLRGMKILAENNLHKTIFEQEFSVTELSFSTRKEDSFFIQKLFDDMIEKVDKNNAIVLLKLILVLYINGNTRAFEDDINKIKNKIRKTTDRNIRGELFFLESFIEKKILSSTLIHFQRMYEMVGGESKLMDSIWPIFSGLPNMIYVFYVKAGNLNNEIPNLEKTIMYINRLTKGNALGLYEFIQADIQFFRGNIKKARALYKLAAGKAVDRYGIRIKALAMQVKCALMMGEFLGIGKEYNALKSEFSTAKGSLVEEFFDLFVNDLAVFSKQYDEIYASFKTLKEINKNYKYAVIPFALRIKAIYLIHQNEYQQLEQFSTYILKKTEYADAVLVGIYFNIFNSIANLKLGNYEKAKESLETALETALLDFIVLPFGELFEHIENLLILYKSKEKYSKLVEKAIELDTKFKQSLMIIASGIHSIKSQGVTKEKVHQALARIYSEDMNNPFPENLSAIEFKCCHLASKRYKNNEIAKELGVSESTVKQALFRSFKKLGIRNRQQLYNISKDI